MKKLTAQQRDEFLDKAAMMAMHAFIGRTMFGKPDSEKIISSNSYIMAEALLAERDRRTEEK